MACPGGRRGGRSIDTAREPLHTIVTSGNLAATSLVQPDESQPWTQPGAGPYVCIIVESWEWNGESRENVQHADEATLDLQRPSIEGILRR